MREPALAAAKRSRRAEWAHPTPPWTANREPRGGVAWVLNTVLPPLAALRCSHMHAYLGETPMTRFRIRELKAHASELIRRVHEDGETIEITLRGRAASSAQTIPTWCSRFAVHGGVWCALSARVGCVWRRREAVPA